jgi:hypothetical protein
LRDSVRGFAQEAKEQADLSWFNALPSLDGVLMSPLKQPTIPVMKTTAAMAIGWCVLLGSCSRQNHPAPAHESLGNVMVQVAHRFEIAGKAASVNRFELAEFEAGEIQETFATDVPAAELPKEGPTAHIALMAKAFLDTSAPELMKAAKAKDRAAFAVAFARTAAACNACHQASVKGFIQVPSVPGRTVPDLEPVPMPALPSGPPR